MDEREIQSGVKRAIEQWTNMQSPFLLDAGLPSVRLSEGATELLVRMISNIEKDASPFWPESIDKDAVQRYAISIIPNILNDLARPVLRRRRPYGPYPTQLSSWELLHRMSGLLDNWGFIPKDL